MCPTEEVKELRTATEVAGTAETIEDLSVSFHPDVRGRGCERSFWPSHSSSSPLPFLFFFPSPLAFLCSLPPSQSPRRLEPSPEKCAKSDPSPAAISFSRALLINIESFSWRRKMFPKHKVCFPGRLFIRREGVLQTTPVLPRCGLTSILNKAFSRPCAALHPASRIESLAP